MNLKSKTFCILPWIEKFQSVGGNRRLCCHSAITINPLEVNGIRTKLSNHEPIPHCESCYKLEQQQTISPRLSETSRWLKHPGVKAHIEHWQPGDPDRTFFYDLRFDNKCNLACIMCGPSESSLWSRELGIKINSHLSDFDHADIVASDKVYMAGGEPLIIDKCIQLLMQIADQDQQPEIVINTNLTRVNPNIQMILQRIKNLTLVISVDAYYRVNEYHRWPMKWNKFINNLAWATDIGCTIQFNTVVDAVSIMSTADLVNLESSCTIWNLTILTNPIELQINNLPDHARDQVRDSWEKIKSSKFFKSDTMFKSRALHASHLLDQPGSSADLAKYITTLDKRRNINHQDFLPITIT